MPLEAIAQGPDGFYHPASEEELAALVKKAYHDGREIRVRGAAHSVARAVYTDTLTDAENRVERQTPPPGDGMNVMLDRYRGYRVVDAEKRLVEADAGINLGRDPSDPTGTSTLENSLLYQLWRDHGWTLSDTGGITHQTVSGFTATGSSGGSLKFSVNANLYGFRMIDGRGDVYEVSRDADPDEFHAFSPNMGLLGIVSKITFQCEPAFNITGQEAITTYDDCSVDLFGANDGRPTLERFLKEVDYTRLEWWPQRGGERMIVWQAQRIDPQLGFRPVRYQEFTNRPEAAELFISLFYTIIGNLDDLSKARHKLNPTFEELKEALELLAKAMGVPAIVADALAAAARLGVDAVLLALQPFGHWIRERIPEFFPRVLAVFEQLDSEKEGMSKGEPQAFHDWSWRGLPMDNQADDTLVPTEFTEMWIPIQHATRVMQLLNAYFAAPSDAGESYERTGTYGWEIYGAEPTKFWMSASHSDGGDEWKDGVVRVDIYWFANNPGNPAETFYPQHWRLLRDAGIPFRLHWGKFQPVYARGDRQWVDFFRAQYPRWDDFLRLRERKDPNNVFLNEYWRERFGLWDAPRPRPVPVEIAATVSASAGGGATQPV